MEYAYREATTGGLLQLLINDDSLRRNFFEEGENALLTIAWNRGVAQSVWVDEVEHRLERNDFFLLIVSHTYRFERPEDITAWRFNREFYCIVDHDAEVSCVGFLFYGFPSPMKLSLDERLVAKIELLNRVFIDEFETHDNIQGEMMRMLLKRLIIILTRLGKEQHLQPGTEAPEYDIVRQFSLLVEKNYRQLRQVSDYAKLMHKSPKTISNTFRKLSNKTPLQLIHDRITLEGKRLLLYTDKTISEIAYELGFVESSHFSRFFKSATGTPPSALRE